jgi:segregation and condensation protein B
MTGQSEAGTQVQRGLELHDPLQTDEQIEAALEALLFAAQEPLTLAVLSDALGLPENAVRKGLQRLQMRMDAGHGLQLVQIAGGYQLSTRPEYAPFIARLLNPPMRRLTRSALEVLAIAAYEQPVTQAQIDALRGVDSSYSVRQLVERGFLQEVGRKPTPGRPVLYGTTPQFLHYFGLNDLSELPEKPLEDDTAKRQETGSGK